jgi:uncharacterized glyoxalase superfamily protein PhnB
VTAAQLRDVSPVLLVTNVTASADYYRDKLGFSVEGFWGEPPMFSIVMRDGLRVMLNQVGAGDRIYPNGGYDGRYSVYLSVSDADVLHAEAAANGADIVCPPDDMPYMMREFSVRDPDGHLLAFGHDITPKGAANG